MMTRYAAVIAKRPPQLVDVEQAIRNDATVVKIAGSAFAAAAALSALLALVPTTGAALGLLLIALPYAVNIVAALLIARGGGWFGAAVSNLKMRPDIGLAWLFNLPEFRRMHKFIVVQFMPMIVFFPLQAYFLLNASPGSERTWLYAQCAFLVVLGVVQAAIFWKVNVPVARIVQGRLAEAPAVSSTGHAADRGV